MQGVVDQGVQWTRKFSGLGSKVDQGVVDQVVLNQGVVDKEV